MRTYNVSEFRLAASLIANGFNLLGISEGSYLQDKKYIFEDCAGLHRTIIQIENLEDQTHAKDLFFAIDTLSKRLTAHSFQKYLEQNNNE